MINWIALQADYKFINRDPDPLVQPVTIHWRCEDVDGDDVGSIYGADGVPDLPEFLESQMIRVTTTIMLNWLHNAMGVEWVAEKEAAATAALVNIQVPPTGSCPPDDT